MSVSQKIRLTKRKIAIIGAGRVGASIAYALTLRNIAQEIVLVNRNKEKAVGEALDIQHGIPYMGTSSVYSGDYSDCKDCDLIILTVGRSRKEGESRINLVHDNVEAMHNIIDKLIPHYTSCPVLIVSNPVDILVSLCDKWLSGNGRVFGTGCILDSSRFVRCIADYVSLSTSVINGMVVGEHGDLQIPLWSKLFVAGIPMEKYCHELGIPWDTYQKKLIADRVRNMGATIIAAKEKTHYGIATCVCMLADAVISNRATIVSVSSPLTGEFGINDVSLSMPSIVSSVGVERRLEDQWEKLEMDKFYECADKMSAFMRENLFL